MSGMQRSPADEQRPWVRSDMQRSTVFRLAKANDPERYRRLSWLAKANGVRLAKANDPAGGAENCLWLAKANGG